jgi:hypothetical protein
MHVTAVYPGAIATNISVNSGVAMMGDKTTTKRSKMNLCWRFYLDGKGGPKVHF